MSLSAFAWFLRGMVLGKIDVETPAHKVLRKTAFYEIRQYPPAVMAAVYSDEMDNMRDEKFMNAGFRVLAGYIGVWQKGKNVAKVRAGDLGCTGFACLKGVG